MSDSLATLLIGVMLIGCGTDESTSSVDSGLDAASVSDVTDEGDTTPKIETAEQDTTDVLTPPSPLRVVTFNTGSGPELAHDSEPDDGYSSEHAIITDTYYGNGLAFGPFVAAAAAFFDDADPDIVVFQEIFWPGDCPGIPEDARSGFVCETWEPGDPTVVEMLLGADYQVACHPNKPDKCAAVHKRVGRFSGCDEAVCLDGLMGSPVPDCGSGARIARGLIEREGEPDITLVSVHGSSGFGEEDRACRFKQVAQVFDDLGDGAPGANGTHNLIMGDFNTDPSIAAGNDESADRWLAETAPGQPFRFLTAHGVGEPATYGGVFNIDHVVTDAFAGDCWAAGITEGHPPVMDAIFFDHVPIVCDLTPAP